MSTVRIQYFLDPLSQWCYIADRSLSNVRTLYPDRIELTYHFVPISGRDPIYVDAAGQRSAYERSEMITGVHTTPWLRDEPRSTWQANTAILAATSLGADIEKARTAVSSAALERAVPLGDDGAAAALLADTFGIERSQLETAMESAVVLEQMNEAAHAFAQFGCTLRPAFVLENTIGDRIVLNGGWREPLLAEAVNALLSDAEGYERYHNHYGS